MAKTPMSVRMPEEDKRLIDAISYVLGIQQVDVLTRGLRMYFDSLSQEDQDKIKKAEELKK